MKLGGLGSGAMVSFNGGPWIDVISIEIPPEPDHVQQVCSLIAAAGPIPAELGGPKTLYAQVVAAIHQDDDAHETCSLTACLNPLHPGPCKGWKGNLFKVAPNAFHALEAARVEKANANRLKKIEALKQAGKPIPKKLLQPIVAKPHPHAGKTANAATGEAHEAGKAISQANGIHVSEPGKITLGQAVKQIKATDATQEKGKLGKKPTVASKGIAHVIAQEKVTPAYKLDKAASITPEQWAALSADEKAIIRGELAHIQKEGFGPQQKKATELLAKLTVEAPKATQPKTGGLTPGAPNTITTPSGKVYQKVTLAETPPLPKTASPLGTQKLIKQAGSLDVAFAPGSDAEKTFKDVGVSGDHQHYLVNKGAGNWYITDKDGKQLQFLSKQESLHLSPSKKESPKSLGDVADVKHTGTTKPKSLADVAENVVTIEAKKPQASGEPPTATQAAAAVAIANAIPGIKSMPGGASNPLVQAFDKLKSKGNLEDAPQFKAAVNALAQKALKVAAEDKMPGLGRGENDAHIGTFNKEIAEHIKEGKPGLPPLVAQMVAHHEKVKAHEDANLTKIGEMVKAHEATASAPKAPAKLSDIATPATAMTTNGMTPMTPTRLVKQIQKHGSVKITHGGIVHNVSFENGPKDNTHLIQVTGIGSGTGHYVLKTPSGESIHLSKGEQVQVHTPDLTKTVETPKVTAAEKPKPLPAHVEHAIAMAKGHAPGGSWSKNHLAAYLPVQADEFHALPQDVQDKIKQELHKAQDKLIDPKKKKAVAELLERFKGKGDKIENVDLGKDALNHQVTQAQAKEAVANANPAAVHHIAQEAAGITVAEDPDSKAHKLVAEDSALAMLAQKVSPYGEDVVKDKTVKAAIDTFKTAETNLAYTQAVGNAKQKAFNKVSSKLYADGHPTAGGSLSPIQKASLESYKTHLLNHPVDTDSQAMHNVQVAADDASQELNNALAEAFKKANAPADPLADLSPAQIKDKTAKLLGPDAVSLDVSVSYPELKDATAEGMHEANAEAAVYSPDVKAQPAVAAKITNLGLALGQLKAEEKSQEKLNLHIANKHNWTLQVTGTDANGNPLTADDKAIIEKHKELLKQQYAYLGKVHAEQVEKVAAAKAALHDAAKAAQEGEKPQLLNTLTDQDKQIVGDAYAKAWSDHASKAVLYGVKTYTQKQQMKEHPEYAQLTHDLGNLRALSGKVALAHAEAHTAESNVPIDPDTGTKLEGPEKKAWIQAELDLSKLEYQAASLHKQAQARLDKIRTDVGLKKRSLPKLDAPAVKASAAESGYYKTGGFGGINYGKSAKAKQYMMAKVGPKHAVAHQSPSEKKAEKLATQAAKIENVPEKPSEPVKLGGADSSITHIPQALKKQITSDFKGMPSGKYLADPAQDVFDNVVNLAAAHGKNVPGGLSVDQVLKTIDETHAKNMGFPNAGKMHEKVMEWLGTPGGKQYAETHSTPNPKVVKQITGEVTLPKGVTLAPGEKVQTLAGPGPHDTSIPAGAFKAHTSAEAQAEQDAYKKAQGITWTAAQKKAMTAYTGNGSSAYNGINNYLRGKGGYDQVVKQYAVDIQSSMMPLREHTLLKRGTGFSGLPFDASNALQMVGKTFEDAGFTSSSVAGSGGHFSGQPLQLIIEAPKGTPAVFVNGISHYKNSENEMLLAAGTKYKILSAEKTSGGHILMRVRVVGEQ